MTSRNSRFRYHVFVSYSSRDAPWVGAWLVPRLKRDGLIACLDYESFEPGAFSLLEMERAVRQSRKTLLVMTPSYFRSRWTAFENILIQTMDPAAHGRRVIPVLLAPCQVPDRLQALVRIDLTSEAKRSSGMARVLKAIRARVVTSRPGTSRIKTRRIPDVPTGALLPTSPLYIDRDVDAVARDQVVGGGTTSIVSGARQMGKSSLLARVVAHARRRHFRVVDFDLQVFDDAVFSGLETLLLHLARSFERRLRAPLGVDKVWGSGLSVTEKFTALIEEQLLGRARVPVVVVLDEVDRVFGRAYQQDFFGMLRSWHNARAMRPAWKRLNLVLAISADPTQAIRDPNQSPFNVGKRVVLTDFSPAQVVELNRRWGRPLGRAEIASVVRLTGGHPYLVQVALHAVATGAHTLRALLAIDDAEQGPFGEHLLRYHRALERDQALCMEMRRALSSHQCTDGRLFHRLRAMGLVKGRDRAAVAPRCRLYGEYFSRVLS